MRMTEKVSLKSILAGKVLKKYSSGLNSVVPETRKRILLFFNVETYNDTKNHTCNRSGHTDRSTRHKKDAQDRVSRRPHRPKDGNVMPLILHQHYQSGDDIESRDENDQRQNQTNMTLRST